MSDIMPPIDIIDWFVMPLSTLGLKNNGVTYGRDTHHLEGVKADGSHVYAGHHRDPNRVIFVKSDKGYPWDIKNYDSNFVYDYQTELNWSDPRSYRRFINPKFGIPMARRFVEGLPNSIITQSNNYTLVAATNCVQSVTKGVGQICYTLTDPFFYDFGGNLGAQPTSVLQYFWNGVIQRDGSFLYTHREQLYLTPTYGWVIWTHYQWVNGEYVNADFVNHNQLTLGGCPTPILPCP